jgi:hypothetical protein
VADVTVITVIITTITDTDWSIAAGDSYLSAGFTCAHTAKADVCTLYHCADVSLSFPEALVPFAARLVWLLFYLLPFEAVLVVIVDDNML